MSSTVSADGLWQWDGHRWKRVAPGWSSEQVDILNENNSKFYQDIDIPLNPEEIELTEVDLSDDTPLLEQIDGIIEAGGAVETGVAGGFTSAATAASTPGVTAIATGIVGTLATVGTGILGGVLSTGSSDDTSTDDSTPDRS